MSRTFVRTSRARREAGPFRSCRRFLGALVAAAVLGTLPACAGPAADLEGAPLVRVRALDSGELTSAARLHPSAAIGAGWLLRSADARFGGFSGLLLDRDRLLLLSDRGWLWSVERGPRAAPPFRSGSWQVRALRVEGRPPDAEELARSSDGRILIALEGRHALAQLPRVESANGRALELEPRPLPAPLARLPANRGIEALAGLPGDTVLAIAEHGPGDLHPAALLAPGGPRFLAYRSAPGFAPTGAAWHEGWLYVVERRLSALSGFTARLTATPVGDPADLPDPIEPLVELARLGGSPTADNIEAVAVETVEPGGPVRLWLVSDDNYSPLQRTVLLTLEWTPQAFARASIRRFNRTSSDGKSASETERR